AREIVDGLNAAVIPAGRFAAVRLTFPANPFRDVTVTVRLTEPLTSVVCVPGVTDSRKAGWGVPAQAVRARKTFKRPPLVVFPASDARGSTVFRISARS